MVDDKHGTEFPAYSMRQVHPNPDPHEEDTTWCRRCVGMGRLATAGVAQVCPECDGLGVTNGDAVVRRMPNGSATIDEAINYLEDTVARLKWLRGHEGASK